MNTKPKLVLAIDIERSGGRSEHDTIAIGSTVIDEEFNELDRFERCIYIHSETNFEQRCWDEFWSKNTDALNQLVYKGNKMSKENRENDMINAFQSFRAKWEQYATDNDMELTLYSDNNVYDGGYINNLICKYTDQLPIPYTSGSQKYASFYETGSMFKGILAVVDPSYSKGWGYSNRIRELYNVPEMTREHNHTPADDAYTIAFDAQIINGIQRGKITLK